MELLILSAADVQRALPMERALEAVEQAYVAMANGEVQAPARLCVTSPEVQGLSLFMGGRMPRMDMSQGHAVGGKVVSVFPRNRADGIPVVPALVTLLDEHTGVPRAILEGTTLTALRTGAASGVSAKHLARPGARVGALIGCGSQAVTQLRAMLASTGVEEVRVCGRSLASAERFVEQAQASSPAHLRATPNSEEAIRGAEVVFVATTSSTPVLDGAALEPGAHVAAVGSFRLDQRELDAETIRGAKVFVDDVEACLEEAGELVAAIGAGVTHAEDWQPLGAVIAGSAPGRTSDTDRTCFKSVGHIAQDLAAAEAALESALALGLGQRVRL